MLRLTQSVLLTLALGAELVLGSPLRGRSSYTVKECHPVPATWSNVSSAPLNHIVNLQIGLKQGKLEELERRLYEGDRMPSYST